MVSIHATLYSNIDGTTARQTIIFSHVDTNLGGGYNATTGVFTAPVAGQYQFSLTFMLYYPSSSYSYYGDLNVLKNGNTIILVRADTHPQPGYFDTASGTTVIGLNKGDKVSVVANSARLYIYGGDYTYFSGFLIG